MNEAVLSDRLSKDMAKAMPGCVDFKFFDRVTEGIPDRAITWNRRTMWVELKFDKGDTSPAQVVTMRRLGQMGLAYFVRFCFMKPGIPVTLVYPPTVFWSPEDPLLHLSGDGVSRFEGHNTRAVAEFIRKAME